MDAMALPPARFAAGGQLCGAAAVAALVWAAQARPAEAFDWSWEPVPRGYHNFFVLVVSLLTLLWAAKVAQKLYVVITVQRRLETSPALALEGMSLYVEDFQRLIRQHFNQILRMRVAPSTTMDRRALSVHLRPESLETVAGGPLLGLRFCVDALAPCTVRLYWGVSAAACNGLLQQAATEASAGSGGGRGNSRRLPEARWGPSFAPLLPQGPGPTTSAAAPAAAAAAGAAAAQGPMSGSVVEITERSGGRGAAAAASAASDAGALGGAVPDPVGDLFGPSECAMRSAPSVLPAGTGRRYETPAEDYIDRSSLPFDLGAAWPPREGDLGRRPNAVPLAIALTAHAPAPTGGSGAPGRPLVQARTQVTFVRFRGDPGADAAGPLAPEVLHQVALGDDGLAHRLLGIFGFEAEGEEEYDCMICYDRPRSVLLFPCRHCSVCPSCLRSLRDERCPLCRSVFSAYLLFPVQTA